MESVCVRTTAMRPAASMISVKATSACMLHCICAFTCRGVSHTKPATLQNQLILWSAKHAAASEMWSCVAAGGPREGDRAECEPPDGQAQQGGDHTLTGATCCTNIACCLLQPCVRQLQLQPQPNQQMATVDVTHCKGQSNRTRCGEIGNTGGELPFLSPCIQSACIPLVHHLPTLAHNAAMVT